ncbi:phosphocarrier protein HPr [Salinibacterium amurskyense]|uniref:Phosphocarrier protein HPr n=1 Tax=Salinibacterium amurskyense TaxID=205941 RepID=A0A2M9D7R6_9MICO|nr:HPr family phosphocarrier protein [Salinibacterium amurskyense]PJJ81688.1 phosphocarrier protein HPr [Salinibacterium amurskyense]RLQ83667.1 HPr family phosphocarrier protein [Salinibacterium amurskyense]GHD79629.1 phosphocarrier protein HPr [Salinibacterium amurskyense]
MSERTATIVSPSGLHARPAALFTQAVSKSGLKITVAKDGKAVNAASILAVISLGVSQGETVTLASDDEGADTVLDELAELLATVE